MMPIDIGSRERLFFINKVLKKINSDDVICLAINTDPDWDDYAMSFIKYTKYRFINLKVDTAQHAIVNTKTNNQTDNIYSRNYVIDRQGNIVFDKFDNIYGFNEQMLELMITELLENTKASTNRALSDSTITLKN